MSPLGVVDARIGSWECPIAPLVNTDKVSVGKYIFGTVKMIHSDDTTEQFSS